MWSGDRFTLRSPLIPLAIALVLLQACGDGPSFRFKEVKACSHDDPAHAAEFETIRVTRIEKGLRANLVAPLTCMFTITNPRVTYDRDRVVLTVDNAPFPPDGDVVACICPRHLQFDLMHSVQPGTPIVFLAEDRQFSSGVAP